MGVIMQWLADRRERAAQREALVRAIEAGCYGKPHDWLYYIPKVSFCSYEHCECQGHRCRRCGLDYIEADGFNGWPS